jgi:hypothetical protein
LKHELTRVALELLLHLPRVRVPHDRALVHRPGQQQARRGRIRARFRPLQREDRARVPRERAHERAVRGRPQPRDAVVGARREQAAVRGPVERGDVAGLVSRGCSRFRCRGCVCRFPLGGVPQDERGRERRRGRACSVAAGGRSRSSATPDAPQPRGAVPGPRRQRPAVGRPRDGEHLGAVTLEPRDGGVGDRRAVEPAAAACSRRRGPGPAAGPAAALPPLRNGALQLLHVFGDQVARRQRREVAADRGAAAAARVLGDVGLELEVLEALLHERDQRSGGNAAARLAPAVDEGLVAEDEGGVGEALVFFFVFRKERREKRRVSFFFLVSEGTATTTATTTAAATSDLSRGRIRPYLSSSLTHRGSDR